MWAPPLEKFLLFKFKYYAVIIGYIIKGLAAAFAACAQAVMMKLMASMGGDFKSWVAQPRASRSGDNPALYLNFALICSKFLSSKVVEIFSFVMGKS